MFSQWNEYMGYTNHGIVRNLNQVNEWDWFDNQRGFASDQMWSSIFDTIGGFGQRLSQASAAEEYAAKVNAAKMQAYENARVLAAAQKEYNTKLADFSAKLYEQNAGILGANATNMLQAAVVEHQQNLSKTQHVAGEVSSAYASAGIQVGTGSAEDVRDLALKRGDENQQNTWQGRLNGIQQVLNDKASQLLDAEFTRWQASEKNRFLDAQITQSLY